MAEEFFQQGDLEQQELKETPAAMMDRKKKDDLPKMQVGFIDAVCLPIYKVNLLDRQTDRQITVLPQVAQFGHCHLAACRSSDWFITKVGRSLLVTASLVSLCLAAEDCKLKANRNVLYSLTQNSRLHQYILSTNPLC